MWGVGIIQDIEGAAMHLYALYRHYEADVDLTNGRRGCRTPVRLEDLDIVMTGAIIKF